MRAFVTDPISFVATNIRGFPVILKFVLLHPRLFQIDRRVINESNSRQPALPRAAPISLSRASDTAEFTNRASRGSRSATTTTRRHFSVGFPLPTLARALDGAQRRYKVRPFVSRGGDTRCSLSISDPTHRRGYVGPGSRDGNPRDTG